jgi:teichuronic acid exporter
LSLRQQALSGVFWNSIQQFSHQIVSLIVSIILARILLPSEFGLIAMISVFLSVGRRLLDAGLGQSLIRTTHLDEEDYSTVFFFNLIASLLIYLMIYLGAGNIAYFFSQPLLVEILRWYGIVFIINAFAIIQSTKMTKEMDFKTQMKVSLPSVVLSGIVGIGMAVQGYGVWSLVGQGITQALASAVQLWWYSSWRPKFIFSMDKLKLHFNYGFKLTLTGVIDTIFVNIYSIILGRYFAVQQLGYFQRADSLKQLPVTNISNVIEKVSFPLFAKIKDDDVKLRDVYKRILKLVTFIIAPTLLFMAVLAEPLIVLLFSEKWLPSVPYFQIICWAGILFPIHSYNLNILKVKGRTDLLLKLEILKKVLIVVSVMIGFQFGITGILYSSVAVSVLSFWINTHYTDKFINYSSRQQALDILPVILLAVLSSVAVYFINILLKDFLKYEILQLMIPTLVGIFIYLLISKVLKFTALQEILNILSSKNNSSFREDKVE